MKILAITNLFPNPAEPGRGIFNKQQFLALSKLCELKVVAPIPAHRNKTVPKDGNVAGIETFYPRYFITPKVFRSLYGFFFYLSLRKFVANLRKKWQFDMILAVWAYPDGFGSWLIAKELGVPVVIMVQGSDINLYTKYLLRRKMIAHSLNAASAVISVSRSLKQRMTDIGVNADKIKVVPNGVNKDNFKPMPLIEARGALALPLERKIVLFAGNLVAGKGADRIIEAFPLLLKAEPSALLVIVGDGAMKNTLEARAAELAISEYVIFTGRQPHEKIPHYMNASNVFCLPSDNEGCPNVILEALACSVPVVGSDVPGISEVLEGSQNSVLFPAKDISALSERIVELLSKNPDKKSEASSMSMSWQENAVKLHQILNDAAAAEKDSK